MSTDLIDIEEDIAPLIRDMLDGVAHRFAGEPVLGPAIFTLLVREALQHLTPRERCLVLNNLTERYGRYVQ